MKYLPIVLILALLPAAAALSPMMCNTAQASDLIFTGQLITYEAENETPLNPWPRENATMSILEVEKGTVNEDFTTTSTNGTHLVDVTGYVNEWRNADYYRVHVYETRTGYEQVFCDDGEQAIQPLAQLIEDPVQTPDQTNQSPKNVTVQPEETNQSTTKISVWQRISNWFGSLF